ncbi:MAG: B12-binding domain-containing radical SAM protein [Planctomycetes bacterium]|nr:B12-binding domain-containing radical SAM protein [Planctomycetota bacterium]
MNIALLAMSGIRACDQELVELGLTLPGFVERSKQIAALPSLGLLLLAAYTPDGHDVAYFEVEGDGAEPDEIYDFDLVAISTFTAQAFEAYAIADRLRARGVTVAIGGLHATAMPDEAFEHADHVCVGEGEHVWPEIVRAVEAGAPQRIWDARGFGTVDVSKLRVPRYDLLGDRPYNRYTVQTTRGCPWRCEFCASTVMLGLPYRKRPVADVVRDIHAIRAHAPGAFLEFADDNTFVDKAWSRELLRALEPLDVHWFTETDISVADDPELLDLMARSGCRQVLVGLESPRPAALRGIELHRDFKAARGRDYEAAIRRIQEHGVTVNGCFVLGLDEDGPDVFDEIREFADRVGLYEVQITVMTAFPGTPLYRRLEREGRLLAPGEWQRCTLFDVGVRPKRMSPERLREGLFQLTRELYEPDAVRRRRAVFFAGRRSRLVKRSAKSTSSPPSSSSQAS